MTQDQTISTIPDLIQPQPDETTCGPTCLQTLYAFYDDHIPLSTVIGEVERLAHGGTLGSLLANHALKRGYDVTIYTYNLKIFDPTWFGHDASYIMEKLQKQACVKKSAAITHTGQPYISFLDLGGTLKYEDLTEELLRSYLYEGVPLLCGLSATCLYRSMREYGPNMDYDDIRGEPSGHFVLLYGYNREDRTVEVADPIMHNPAGAGNVYTIGVDRVINAILLGIVTDDANLVVITPRLNGE